MHNKLITTNIIFYCENWDLTVRFYRDQLELPVIFSTDWFVEFRLNSVSRLSIADEKRASIKSCAGKGVTLSLEVEELETMKKCMAEVGLKPTIICEHPWSAKVFHLFDPEGHRIEIWQKSTDETTR